MWVSERYANYRKFFRFPTCIDGYNNGRTANRIKTKNPTKNKKLFVKLTLVNLSVRNELILTEMKRNLACGTLRCIACVDYILADR